jgi:Spy/CpxP family protein refolding chaperone
MKIRLLIILFISLLILRVPIAGGRGHGHHPSWHPEDLQLTAEQVEKLESIQGSYLNDITPLRSDFLNKRYELRRLIADPTSKADDIRAKQGEALALETQIQEKVIDYQLKVRRMDHRHGMDMMHR